MRNVLTDMPYGLPGKICRSPMPFSPMFDPGNEVLDAYIRAGVEVVVMLASDAEIFEVTGRRLRNVYEEMGLEVIYSPMPDFSVPEERAFQETVRVTLQAAREGRTVAIHCHAGLGRTGILAACLAKVLFDLDGDEAFAWVRQHVPNAVETSQQLQFICDFKYIED